MRERSTRNCFHEQILRNLLANHTKPVHFDVVLSFQSEIAQILYTHLDLILVHPAEARAGIEGGGHADSNWSCVQGLQIGRSACPPACCITPSVFVATT